MLISQQKKKSNIAEYLLYMWQLEDIIRALNFDSDKVSELLVTPLTIDAIAKEEIKQWYIELIAKMRDQGLLSKGHLSELNDLMIELKYLHETLINVIKDPKYVALYLSTKLNIDALRSKSELKSQNEIEVCLNGLYGLLMLRLKKEEISKETTEAMQSISKLIAYLSDKYLTANKTGKV